MVPGPFACVVLLQASVPAHSIAHVPALHASGPHRLLAWQVIEQLGTPLGQVTLAQELRPSQTTLQGTPGGHVTSQLSPAWQAMVHVPAEQDP
jgi:hypothetical protein